MLLLFRFIYYGRMKLTALICTVYQSLASGPKLILCLLGIKSEWLTIAWVVNKSSYSKKRCIFLKPVAILLILRIKYILLFQWLKLYLFNRLFQLIDFRITIVLINRMSFNKPALVFLLLLTQKYFVEIIPIRLIVAVKIIWLLFFGCTLCLLI